MAIAKRKDKPCGKWVAIKSFNDDNVVASGKDIIKVAERAKQKGFPSPVILYVPTQQEVDAFYGNRGLSFYGSENARKI